MTKKQPVLKHQKAKLRLNEDESIQKKSVFASLKMVLEFPNEKIAKSICEATSPENSETPSGTTAISHNEGKKIIFQVKSDSKFKDLITTVEDFLEKVELSRKTIDIIDND